MLSWPALADQQPHKRKRQAPTPPKAPLCSLPRSCCNSVCHALGPRHTMIACSPFSVHSVVAAWARYRPECCSQHDGKPFGFSARCNRPAMLGADLSSCLNRGVYYCPAGLLVPREGLRNALLAGLRHLLTFQGLPLPNGSAAPIRPAPTLPAHAPAPPGLAAPDTLKEST